MRNIGKITANEQASLMDLLKLLNEAPSFDLPGGIVIITDERGTVSGIVTDGDIRRCLLTMGKMEVSAGDFMTRNPIVFPDSFSINQILESIPKELEKRNRQSKRFLSKILLVDDQNKPTRILDYHQLWEQRVAIHRHLCVVGLGYVGLTLALVLADEGYLVTGVDTDETRIQSLQNGNLYVHEVGLPELLREQIDRNFKVTESVPEFADVYIVAVGTPIEIRNGKKVPAMHYLESAIREIATRLRRGNLVVLRSTVPVGTCRDIVKQILETETGLKCGLDFHLSFAPERTAEGKALKELRSLPQIIGGYNNDSVEATSAIFREITPTIVRVDSLEAAEMAKLINNSFRDYIFAYSNQIALLSSHFNINAFDVIRAANEGYPRDPVPLPSPGVGGPCLTKDPYIFADVAESANLDAGIFHTGRNINVSMHDHVVTKVFNMLQHLGKKPETSKILVCGLSFKGNPETGDLRDSTSVEIALLIKNRTKQVFGYDAVATGADIEKLGIVSVQLPSGFDGMDAVIFLNNHRSFESIDVFEMVRAMGETPIVFDAWDLFRSEDVIAAKPSIYMGLSFTKSSITK